jgi:Rhodopirellula transposase DDE domain
VARTGREGAYEDCAAILLEDAHMGAPLPLAEACQWIDQYHRTHGLADDWASPTVGRLFKIELHRLAQETGLTIKVCHYPPGTSKWNKIEHRLFCHITQTWRGKPLVSRETVVELIASTTTRTGLIVRCELDTRDYPKGIKVSDEEMDALNITGDTFHPEWNYTISPTAPI